MRIISVDLKKMPCLYIVYILCVMYDLEDHVVSCASHFSAWILPAALTSEGRIHARLFLRRLFTFCLCAVHTNGRFQKGRDMAPNLNDLGYTRSVPRSRLERKYFLLGRPRWSKTYKPTKTQRGSFILNVASRPARMSRTPTPE